MIFIKYESNIKKILVAVESSASFYKGDLSISNEKIYDSLNELKKNIRESYDGNNTLEETKIDEYKDFINNYLKIEWEKLNQEKHNPSILKMFVI